MLLDWMEQAPQRADDPVSGFDPDAVTVSETIDIAAPARVVWQILTDMPRYNEWNPFCDRAQSTIPRALKARAEAFHAEGRA